jgi:RNA polymerase sigma-70 factor, ECF subfamily
VSDSESAIIERVRSGDVERFGELVSRHQDQVYGMLRRLVPDPETAEDLAQTAFLKAFEGLSGFRQTSSFATWVTQIAIHLARDDHRRRRRAEIVPLEDTDDFLAGSDDTAIRATSASPLEDTIADDLHERLTRAIADLPADYREVFVLRHIEENSYEEIASLTGVSEGALKVRNHRARKILLDRLREEDEPPVLRLHRR